MSLDYALLPFWWKSSCRNGESPFWKVNQINVWFIQWWMNGEQLNSSFIPHFYIQNYLIQPFTLMKGEFVQHFKSVQIFWICSLYKKGERKVRFEWPCLSVSSYYNVSRFRSEFLFQGLVQFILRKFPILYSLIGGKLLNWAWKTLWAGLW